MDGEQEWMRIRMETNSIKGMSDGYTPFNVF